MSSPLGACTRKHAPSRNYWRGPEDRPAAGVSGSRTGVFPAMASLILSPVLRIANSTLTISLLQLARPKLRCWKRSTVGGLGSANLPTLMAITLFGRHGGGPSSMGPTYRAMQRASNLFVYDAPATSEGATAYAALEGLSIADGERFHLITT